MRIGSRAGLAVRVTAVSFRRALRYECGFPDVEDFRSRSVT